MTRPGTADWIVLFAKCPVPGRVKTRLVPPLSPEQAAGLYRSMARRAWRTASASGGRTRAWVALDPCGISAAGTVRAERCLAHGPCGLPEPNAGWLGSPGEPSPPFFLQEGLDLGARLLHAAGFAIARGAGKALLVGSDSPEIRSGHLEKALDLLDSNDVVLGPARDGGYYLIGLKQLHLGLFRGIPWSTDGVLAKTLERIRDLGLAFALLEELRDVDTPDDLEAAPYWIRRRVRPSVPRSLLRPAASAGALLAALILARDTAGAAREGESEAEPAYVVVDRFSAETEDGTLPKGWKPLTFKKIERRTRYTLDRDGSNFFVKAESSKSASGLLKEVSVQLEKHPILSWRWKVDRVLDKADATRKSGDDYAARVYVAFAYDPERASLWEKTKYGLAKTLYGAYPPKGALNYIWDNKLPVGTTLDNAYTNRAKMVVLESGPEKAGRWVREERNVHEDYAKLFGREPPPLAFVALMTDTDDTGESATAWYDDIQFSARSK